MPRRLIDISVPLKAGIKSDPPHSLPKIDYLDHHMTAPAMAEYIGVRVDQLPDGEYAAEADGRVIPTGGWRCCATSSG